MTSQDVDTQGLLNKLLDKYATAELSHIETSVWLKILGINHYIPTIKIDKSYRESDYTAQENELMSVWIKKSSYPDKAG